MQHMARLKLTTECLPFYPTRDLLPLRPELVLCRAVRVARLLADVVGDLLLRAQLLGGHPVVAPAALLVVERAQELAVDEQVQLAHCAREVRERVVIRYIDRKMRELRGAEIVTVKYVPTDDNTADLFTKVLTRQPFEKHRRRVMNLTDK